MPGVQPTEEAQIHWFGNLAEDEDSRSAGGAHPASHQGHIRFRL